MNTENEFDALAREKLEGRNMPFEENDWTQMQAVLNAHNKRKKRAGFWFGGAAVLLLLIGGAWYLNGTQENLEVAEVQLNNITEERAKPSSAVEVLENAGIQLTEETNATIEVTEKTQISTSEPSSQTDSLPYEVIEIPARKQVKSAAIKSKIVAKPKIITSRPADPVNTEHTPDNVARIALVPNIGKPNIPEATNSPSVEIADPTIPSGVDPVMEPDMNNKPTAITGPVKDQPTTVAVVPDNGDDSSPENNVFNPALAVEANTGIGTSDPLKPEEQATTGGAEYADPSSPKDSTLTDGSGTPLDSSATAQTPNDTVLATPEPIAPLINPASPWEISVFGGAMRTNTRYTGANSDSWNTDLQQQWSINAGMDFMHMGRNFGLGTGLHYGTYSERINSKAIDHTTYDVNNFWYLVPIDTTILTITGTTTVDSTEYFTGVSIDTTINVITRGSDSTAVTEQLRAARETVNKVSYIEIPLLLDGHLVQGRWSLGVRGGPTIGLLTGRRGSIPNDTGDGYTDLTDQPFREVVFGWTARAYVRYRFNAAWSIGIEPMIRGQFNNTLGNGDLTRRSMAYGGQLSLSYRLR